MEIKKFEAYKYRGKGLDSSRDELLDELWSIFDGENILGYEITGTMYEPTKNMVYLFLDNPVDGKYESSGNMKTIRLDLSDTGIDIGEMSWDDDKEDWNEFILLKNLDTNQVKQMKDYKKDLTNYNL